MLLCTFVHLCVLNNNALNILRTDPSFFRGKKPIVTINREERTKIFTALREYLETPYTPKSPIEGREYAGPNFLDENGLVETKKKPRPRFPGVYSFPLPLDTQIHDL
jgi:hypothetical protein